MSGLDGAVNNHVNLVVPEKVTHRNLIRQVEFPMTGARMLYSRDKASIMGLPRNPLPPVRKITT